MPPEGEGGAGVSDGDLIGGIDVGGTKIEARLFGGRDAAPLAITRLSTPQTPDAVVAAILDRIGWLDAAAGAAIPVGLALPGVPDPGSGTVFAANVALGSTPIGPVLSDRAGRRVPILNDGTAFALSEARGGAGTDIPVVLGLVLGTGLGGGVAVEGRRLPPHAGHGLEIGHAAIPATAAARHRLPLRECPCGRIGCLERYVSGRALPWLCGHVTGADAVSDAGLEAWADILAEGLMPVLFALDPGVVVLGGGLSELPGAAQHLERALARHRLGPAALPRLRLARFGATSGARGAALAARDAAC